MKKFKTIKEILITNEFKELAFELLKEEIDNDNEILDDVLIEAKVEKFIDRKLKHCKNQGIL